MIEDGASQFNAAIIERQLDRILSSGVFVAAKRSRMFLRFTVDRTLQGAPPKEFEIAAEVFGRGPDYDPEIDATVRVEASRLRSRLREYYDTEGRSDPLLIHIPKGAYRVVFVSGKPAVADDSPDLPASSSADLPCLSAKPVAGRSKQWLMRMAGAGILALAISWAFWRTLPAQSSNHSHTDAHPRPVSQAAQYAYTRGIYFLHQRNVDQSVTYLKQAVALDPSYAAAYAGLANALTTRLISSGRRPDEESEAVAAAKSAIELDSLSGEAYSALGLLEMYGPKDWAAARRDLEKAIVLSPRNSLAEMQYAEYLDAVGKPEEAVAHMRRALQLDPQSFLMNRHLGATLYFARHYAEALQYLQRAEEIEPTSFGYVGRWSSRSYEMSGRLDDAERMDLRQLNLVFPSAELETLRRAYRGGGWMAYQRARIDLIVKQPRDACDQYDIGESYARLGERDRAFSWFAEGLKARCIWADTLLVDPLLDGIRSDPRFGMLLQMERLVTGSKAPAH